MAEKRYYFIEKLSYEMFRLPNGKVRYIDEKRYGGNGILAWDKAQGRCEVCGTYACDENFDCEDCSLYRQADVCELAGEWKLKSEKPYKSRNGKYILIEVKK